MADPRRPSRRRSARSAAPPGRGLRLGLLMAVLWLLVMALAPVLYAVVTAPVVEVRAQMRVEAIQSIIGPPGETPPKSLAEVKRLCQRSGVPFEADSPWYALRYDEARGVVSYAMTEKGLLIREHVTIIVFQRVQELLVAVVLLIVAAGLGQRVLKWAGLGWLHLTERLLFGTALGLGAMGLATLGLGVVGVLTFWPFAAMVVAMGLVGAPSLVDGARELYRGWKATTTHIGLWSGLMAAAGVLFVSLPLMGAFGPAVDYDSLEYHLGAPAEYYARGHIGRLEGNVYSNFPFNIEMLYLMSMVLRGSVFRGVYLARMLNVLMGVLCALSIWAFGRRFAGPDGSRAGGIGCLLFLSCPWFFWVLTTINVYVTLGLTLFSFLSVYATLIYLYGPQSPAPVPRKGALLLAGMLIGLALGAKYTSALFAAVPLVGWVAVVELLRRGEALRRRIGRTALLAGVSIAVVSPWLVKNAILTGNPTYPLLYKVFGGVDWSDEQDARWRHAHSPAFNAAPPGRAARFWVSDLRIVAPVVVFLPFALSVRRARRVALWLCGFVLYWFLAWLALTHRIDRMLFPMFAVMVALAGWGYVVVERTAARWLGRLVLAGYLVYLALFGAAGYFYIGRQGDLIFGRLGTDPIQTLSDAIKRQETRLELPVDAFGFLRRAVRLGPNNRLLLVGEAEVLYIAGYGQTDFIRSTVFDQNPLEAWMKWSESDADLVHRLRREGVGCILVNYDAIARFRKTYAFPYRGQQVPGYPEGINEAFFTRLTRAGLLRVIYPSDRPPGSSGGCVVYELVEPH